MMLAAQNLEQYTKSVAPTAILYNYYMHGQTERPLKTRIVEHKRAVI